MAAPRTVIWTADSPSDIYPVRVTLDDAGWAHATNAEDGHPEIAPYQDVARETIEKPSRVHESNTRKDSIVFFNDAITNEQGHVLVVPVRVKGFEGIVTSVHFRSPNYRGKLLWKA